MVCFPSRKRRQRDQLFVWVREQREELGPNHEDEELLQTEQCLDEVRTLPCADQHIYGGKSLSLFLSLCGCNYEEVGW